MANNQAMASNQRIHHNQGTAKCPTMASHNRATGNSSRGTANNQSIHHNQGTGSSRGTDSNRDMANNQDMANSSAQGSSPTHQDGITPSLTPDVVISRRQDGKRRGGRRHIPALAASARGGAFPAIATLEWTLDGGIDGVVLGGVIA